MKADWSREPHLIWSFWAAGAFVVLGGAIPFLIGGSSSRIASVFIPFAIAALAFAACALIHEQGRTVTSALYLLAGLAIVYGLLTMFALPLQLAVLGTCPIPPQPCPSGLQHALTVSENTGIGAAAAFGMAWPTRCIRSSWRAFQSSRSRWSRPCSSGSFRFARLPT